MHVLRDQPIHGGGVATAARFGIVAGGFRSALRTVRIVAGLAGKSIFALEKTTRLPEPVSGAADDLKLVVVTGTGGMVEGQQKCVQRLAWRKGKRPAIEPPDHSWNRRAGRLEVTLQAEIGP
jgi:hypothetical protein